MGKNSMPKGCCYPDCFNCPLPDCTYDGDPRRKIWQKRYNQSEKGKANTLRQSKRKIATGQNAEYCRRYYQKHKEEICRKKKEARRIAREQKAV